jgi:hypothetical protein
MFPKKNLRRFAALILFVLAVCSVEGSSKKSDKKDKKTSAKKKSGLTGFIAGRLAPDPALELNRLNGLFTPDEAAGLCEGCPECAGFTFRGARHVGQKFSIKFFRFVDQKTFDEAKRGGNWLWTSYRVKRAFVAVFHGKAPKVSAEGEIDAKSIRGVEQLIERFDDAKFVHNFRWKFPFPAISLPAFDETVQVCKHFSFAELHAKTLSYF